MSDTRPPIAILGPGTVGDALARALHQANWPIAIGGRDVSRAKLLGEQVGASAGDLATTAKGAAVCILTVKDDAIAPVCETLGQAGCWREGDIVLHCSGAMDSGALQAARQAGASCASWHPLQTFPSGEAVASLAEVPFFAEGDRAALTLAKTLSAAVGGEFYEIAPGGKALYHAAAVMACNYVSTMLDSAEMLMDQAGVDADTARAAMGPLVRQTVENALLRGPADTLTGPIARGDADTVRRHLAAMRQAGLGELASLYRAVARQTAEIARRRGSEVCGVLDALNEPTNDSTERENGE
ncbi:MAG: Rossmann-like and DUF2520 domain-containing protein [Planctomycetota bacterium]